MYPRLFHIESLKLFGHDFGTFSIHTYGLIFAIAFFAGFIIFYRNARRGGILSNKIIDLFFFIVISGLLGSKTLHILVEWRYYCENPGEILFAFFRLGGIYYGGLILSVAVSLWLLRRWNLPVWTMTDYAAPGLALGLSLARWGCFFAGCCYGKACNLPWAIVYTDPYTYQSVGTPLGIHLHPVPIYESIAVFIIFIILMILERRKAFEGQVLCLFLILNGFERFINEYYRGDERGFVFNGLLSTSQVISLLVIPLGIILYVYRQKKTKEKIEKK